MLCRNSGVLSMSTVLQSPRSVDGDSAEAGHGTHVAGIAVGSFPEKLLDANGKPLPYQRGVAFGANLGAIRVSSSKQIGNACTAWKWSAVIELLPY